MMAQLVANTWPLYLHICTTNQNDSKPVCNGKYTIDVEHMWAQLVANTWPLHMYIYTCTMPIKIIVSQFKHRSTANTNNKLCFVWWLSVIVCVYIYIHVTCVPCQVLCLHFLLACPCLHKQVPGDTVAILVTLFAYSCKHLHNCSCCT